MQIKLIVSLVLLLFCPARLNAQFSVEEAFPNISLLDPVDLQNAGDGTNRIFIVERAGRIKVIPNSKTVQSTKLFLDITDRVSAGGEMGLLGLAFHPNYENNGYFFVNYTVSNPRMTRISRFTVFSQNPDSADKNSELIILTFSQPNANHNGGWIGFGPFDGYLYIAVGDGGGSGDTQNNAQNITNLLGAILRIDIDNQDIGLQYAIPADNPFAESTGNEAKEIFAWGMRNPWRSSFDPVTGRLWTGDVGQGTWEEIDIIENGKNYGWRCYEGNHPFNISGCNYPEYTFPVWEYSHGPEYSVTGGYVYRGPNVPELTGKYIYADYGSNKIWSLEYDGTTPPTNELLLTAPGSPTSFGVDENNELYVVTFSPDKIYRFTPTVTAVDDEQIHLDYVFKQNFPNPFNPTTVITYSIPELSFITLKIYDVLGNQVAILVNESKPSGTYSVTFDASKYPSGIYFYTINAGNYSKTKKMIYLK